MSDIPAIDFAVFQALIQSEKVLAHGSEIHGLMTGLICGGHAFEDNGYMPLINDFFNNGEGLPTKLKNVVTQVYDDVWQTLLDGNYSFQLMLPDDDEDIVDRCNALSAWVQGFNIGFGILQKDTSSLSEEVAEVIADFAEIANLSDEVEDDENTEQAYFEIMEYVRISSLLCFSELGTTPEEKQENKTLH